MADTTTSGTVFQIPSRLKGQFQVNTNSDTYEVNQGDKTWRFNTSHLGPQLQLNFANDLREMMVALFDAGYRSSGNTPQIDDEEKPQRVEPDEETIAISGVSDPSIVPGASYLTEEQLAFIGSKDSPLKPEDLEIAEAPIAPLPKDLQ